MTERGVIWIMGRPGAGKSTVGRLVVQALQDAGQHPVLLDAGDMRAGPMLDLGFSDKDRRENVERLSLIASLLAVRGARPVIVLAVTPTRELQKIARSCAFLVYLRRIGRPLWAGTGFDEPDADLVVAGHEEADKARDAILEML